jgi:hypothetical protein
MKAKVFSICLFIFALFAADQSINKPEAEAIGCVWCDAFNHCGTISPSGAHFCVAYCPGGPNEPCLFCSVLGQCNPIPF